MSGAAGYQSEPLSVKMQEYIEARLVFLRTELRLARTVLRHRLEGNIGALEWVLREAETLKQSKRCPHCGHDYPMVSDHFEHCYKQTA